MTFNDTQYNFLVSQLNKIDRRLASIEKIIKPIVEDTTILQRHTQEIVAAAQDIENLKVEIASLKDEQEA